MSRGLAIRSSGNGLFYDADAEDHPYLWKRNVIANVQFKQPIDGLQKLWISQLGGTSRVHVVDLGEDW